MKKLIIASTIVLLATNMNAQTVNVSAGKKIQSVSSITLTTTVSQMGQEMEIPTTANVNMDFDVKSISGKTIALSGNVKKIVGSVKMMGNEQTYDSDDPATANNPQMAEALKNLNKPSDISVVAGKTSLPKDITDITASQNSEDVANYLFIPVDAASVKEGYTWSDSASTAEGSKALNNYTVTKVSKEEVIITVVNTNKIITTKQQMGMEVKVNMQGGSTATRVYDVASGVLKTVNGSFISSGNNEVMGNSIPVSIKGTATVTVK